jgi:2-polyprenyl-6-methoxyphenol hydroxylase-like FAD-dependent oxidoreductase
MDRSAEAEAEPDARSTTVPVAWPGKDTDVVVVGGGIAGSALATVLARDGYDVMVLERQPHYRDKVRGEALSCWGVAELLALDLEKPLLDAGGHYVTRFVGYDEAVPADVAEAVATPLDQLVPGVPGVLDVGHPEACEGLTVAAAAAGATVLRGVGAVDVEAGAAPVVRFEHGGAAHEVSCRLVVGADGRTSVVRGVLGIALHQTTPRTMAGGLLVDGLHTWPEDQISLGTEGDLMYFVFPRADGRVRLYLLHDIAQRGRFAGRDRAAAFRGSWDFACIPGREMFADTTAAGPCTFHPMNDSWTDEPSAPGAVLIGDAAGWNDPIIGQGLAVALRDVRVVTDILRAGPDWSPAALSAYGQERRERMRRLRIAAQVQTDLAATFGPAGIARRRAYNAVWRSDPVLAGLRLVPQRGPEGAPAESFETENIDRILEMAP